jgi:hypothetical protein
MSIKASEIAPQHQPGKPFKENGYYERLIKLRAEQPKKRRRAMLEPEE